jgi:hypothetical protein
MASGLAQQTSAHPTDLMAVMFNTSEGIHTWPYKSSLPSALSAFLKSNAARPSMIA